MAEDTLVEHVRLPSAADEPNYFLDECSNPVSWYRRHPTLDNLTPKLGLFSVMDMKHTVLTEQYADNKPEYVWDLFLYNTYISFNYIMQDHLDNALEIINETEKILSKHSRPTENSTDFLDSISDALCHITLTTKGYVLTKSNKSTEDLHDSFVALRDMDAANEAALYAVQSMFLARYVNKWCILSKMCILRAVALNPAEPKWHHLLSYCITHYRKKLRMAGVLPQEVQEAEIAVGLSNNSNYKCHLAKLLHSDNIYYAGSYNQDTLKAITLIKDIVNDSDDIFTLRRCLKTITKMKRAKTVDHNIFSLATVIISKMKNSNNSFVFHSIGYYYMCCEKDMGKAKVYLKMASDGKCFCGSIDYVRLLYTTDPSGTDVVQILDGYLNVYQTISSVCTILILIISYQLLNKNDIVGAMTYIDKLLDYKVTAFIRRLQVFKPKFCRQTARLNLLKVMSDELEKNLDNQTLSAENISSVRRLFEKINDLSRTYVKKKGVRYDLDLMISFLTQNEIVEGKCCKVFNSNSDVRNDSGTGTKTENWRTLKPNNGPNVFTLNKYRYYNRAYCPSKPNE